MISQDMLWICICFCQTSSSKLLFGNNNIKRYQLDIYLFDAQSYSKLWYLLRFWDIFLHQMSYKTPPPGHQLCHAIYIWFYLALSLMIIKTLQIKTFHDINDLVMCVVIKCRVSTGFTLFDYSRYLLDNSWYDWYQRAFCDWMCVETENISTGSKIFDAYRYLLDISWGHWYQEHSKTYRK